MSKSESLDVAKIIATPSCLAQYLAPKIWGQGSVYRADPWVLALEHGVIDAISDRENQRYVKSNAPSQIGKSMFDEVFVPFWALGFWPDTRVILIGYSDAIAQRSGGLVRDLVKLYGPELFNIDLDPDYQSKADWKLAGRQGGMLSVGIGSQITGRSGDLVIIGDVIKNMEEAGSKATKDHHWEEWEGSIETRAQPGTTYLLAATRFADDDLSGRFEAKEREPDYEGIRWENYIFPAIAEPTFDEDGDDPEWRDIIGRVRGEPLQTRFSKPGDERPENWEDSYFYKLRKRKGPYVWCTPAETPIVMADRTTRPISAIEPGDHVLGFEQRGSDGRRSQLQSAEVSEVGSLIRRVDTLVMESGARVRCTPEHRWFTGRGNGRRPYAPAVVGSVLRRFDPPLPPLTPERQRDLDWMAGIIDGEGHISDSSLVIVQSPTRNGAVCDAIRDCLFRLGWDAKETTRDGVPGTRYTECVKWAVRSPRPVYIELLRRTRLAKRQQVLGALAKRPRMPTLFRDRVVDIIEGAEEEVFALQTTTGNYIAWGYASSNSAIYQQEPTSPTGGMFPSDGWAWYDPDDIPPLMGVRRSWDLAASEGEGDWTVGQKVGKTFDDNFLVLDVLRERKSGGAVKAWVETVAAIDGVACPLIIERERSGAGKTVLEFYALALPMFQVRAGVPDGSKEDRARPASLLQQAGRLKLPRRADGTSPEWVPGYIDELRKMMGDGRKGRHDDQIDTLAYAVNDMLDEAVTYMSVGHMRFSHDRGLMAV